MEERWAHREVSLSVRKLMCARYKQNIKEDHKVHSRQVLKGTIGAQPTIIMDGAVVVLSKKSVEVASRPSWPFKFCPLLPHSGFMGLNET